MQERGGYVHKIRSFARDLRRWVIACPVAYTDLARMSGLTRRAIYSAHDNDKEWNPTLKTMLALSKARDLLEDRGRELSRRKDRS